MTNEISKLESKIQTYKKLINRALIYQAHHLRRKGPWNKHNHSEWKKQDYTYVTQSKEIKLLVTIQKSLKNHRKVLYNELNASNN